MLESLTLTVKGLALAVAVGVPVMAPVAAFSESPAGSAPMAIDHVYGNVPPVAASAALYAFPAWPLGSNEVVIESTPAPEDEMKRVSVAVLVCAGLLESVTVKPTDRLFAPAVGAPVIAPVAALSKSPDGSEPLVIAQR